jgi:anti-sigma-K factor RskA
MAAHDPDHDRLLEFAGLYVLDALGATERSEFERHIGTCAECSAEVRSLTSIAAALPYAVALTDPPPSLRDRVMAVAGRPAAAPATVVPFAARRAKKPSFASSPGWLSAAALLLLSLGLGGYALSLRQQITGLQAEVGDLTARLDRSEQQVAVATRSVAVAEARMAVLTAPDMTQVDLQGQPVAPGASGRAFWSRTRGLVFTAADLPRLPAGRSYQLWVVTAQAAVSAGLLEPDTSGRVAQAFNTPADLPRPVAIAVTDEPAGGVPAPTGDKYLVGLTH